MTTPAEVLSMLKEKEVVFVDLRFTDTRGKEQHVTVPSHTIEAGFFDDGKMFDGSSIAGWKGINESDMVLMPDATTAVMDPFFEETTLIIRCDVLEPATMQGYDRDPRSIGKRAEAYLKATGIGDGALFGPENEFFIFDNVRYGTTMSGSFFDIESIEAAWSSGKNYEDGNKAHRPGVKGGYFPVPPVDSFQDLRSAMCLALEELGMKVEVHHHEVATAGQCEIGVNANSLVRKADEVQMLKYAIHNVAHAYGKTVTFMPKPIVGDNGSGMHVHQSIQKDGKALFAGDKYAGLSDTALYYIGGYRRHSEQDPPGRARGQGSVRPAAGRSQEHPGSVLLAGTGDGSTRQGPRLPQGGRRVYRRRHRCLHWTEDAGRDQGADVHAPARVRVVLQRVNT